VLLNQIKTRSMKFLTKELLVNAGVTLAVVMVALYVHDSFVKPSGDATKSKAVEGSTEGTTEG